MNRASASVCAAYQMAVFSFFVPAVRVGRHTFKWREPLYEKPTTVSGRCALDGPASGLAVGVTNSVMSHGEDFRVVSSAALYW